MSILLLSASIFSSMAFWFASSLALSAFSWTFSLRTSVYLFVSRSMDSCSFLSTSIRRVFRVANQVTTDPSAPPGSTHWRMFKKSSCSILLTIHYWLIPMERSHAGTLKLGQSLAATWLWPMIFTSGNFLWKSFT